jgi:hypothetical protein
MYFSGRAEDVIGAFPRADVKMELAIILLNVTADLVGLENFAIMV